jgi:hypothetical protein
VTSKLALGKYQGTYGTKVVLKSHKKWKMTTENANSTKTTTENANSKRLVTPQTTENANSDNQKPLKC